jgi:hypothetical protein
MADQRFPPRWSVEDNGASAIMAAKGSRMSEEPGRLCLQLIA